MAPDPGWSTNLALTSRDQLSRRLRISLVDHCNFDCFFCHNEGQGALSRQKAFMAPDEIDRLAQAAVTAGVREIKLTGGEPTLYRHGHEGIVEIVKRIAGHRRQHVFGLSMTTNGLLLSRLVDKLREAGLDRVTLSLHTLRTETLKANLHSQGSARTLQRVTDGIRAAHRAGLTPLKLNTVLFADGLGMSGNLRELESIADLCASAGVDEWRLYPMISHAALRDSSFKDRYLYWNDEVICSLLRALKVRHTQALVTEVQTFLADWTAHVYPRATLHIQGPRFGVAIEPVKHDRFSAVGLSSEGAYALRLSAKGILHGALEDGCALDLLTPLRKGARDQELVEAFAGARRTLLPRAAQVSQVHGRPTDGS